MSAYQLYTITPFIQLLQRFEGFAVYLVLHSTVAESTLRLRESEIYNGAIALASFALVLVSMTFTQVHINLFPRSLIENRAWLFAYEGYREVSLAKGTSYRFSVCDVQFVKLRVAEVRNICNECGRLVVTQDEV